MTWLVSGALNGVRSAAASVGMATVNTAPLEDSIRELGTTLEAKSGSLHLAQQVHECIPLVLSLTVLFLDGRSEYKTLFDLICKQEGFFIVSDKKSHNLVQVGERREDGTLMLDYGMGVIPRYYSTDGRVVFNQTDECKGVFSLYIEYIILKALTNLATRVTRTKEMSDAQYAAALFSCVTPLLVGFTEQYRLKEEKEVSNYCKVVIKDLFHLLFPGGAVEWNLPRCVKLLEMFHGSFYAEVEEQVLPDLLAQTLGVLQKVFAAIPLQGEEVYSQNERLSLFAEGLAKGAVQLSPKLITSGPLLAMQGYYLQFADDVLREIVKDTKATAFQEMLVKLSTRGLFSILSTIPHLDNQLMEQGKKPASEVLFSLIFKGVLTQHSLAPLLQKLQALEEGTTPEGLEATIMDSLVSFLEKHVIGRVKKIEETVGSLKKRTEEAYVKLWSKYPASVDTVTPFIKQVALKIAVILTPIIEELLKDEDARKELIKSYLQGCSQDTLKELSYFIGEIINGDDFQSTLREQLEYIIIHILLTLWKTPRESTAPLAKTLLEEGSKIFLSYLPALQEAFTAVKGKEKKEILDQFSPVVEAIFRKLGVTKDLFRVAKEGNDQLAEQIGTFLYSLVLEQGALEFAYRYMNDMTTPLGRAEEELSRQLKGNRTLEGVTPDSGLQQTARGIVDYLLRVVLQQETTANAAIGRALSVCPGDSDLEGATTFLSLGMQQFCKDPHQRAFVEKIDLYVHHLLRLLSHRLLREAPHLGERKARKDTDHAGHIIVRETRMKRPAAYFEMITFLFHRVVRNWVVAFPRPVVKEEDVFYKEVAGRLWEIVQKKHPQDSYPLPLSSEWQEVAKKGWDELGPNLIQTVIKPYMNPVGRMQLMMKGIGSFFPLVRDDALDQEIGRIKNSSTDVKTAQKLLKRQIRRVIRSGIKEYIYTHYKQLDENFQSWVDQNPRLWWLEKIKKTVVDGLFAWIYRYVLSYLMRYLVLPLVQVVLLPVTLLEGYVIGNLVNWLSGKEWERAYQEAILSFFNDVVSAEFPKQWKEMAGHDETGEGQKAEKILTQDFNDFAAYFIDQEMGGAFAWPLKYTLRNLLGRIDVGQMVEKQFYNKSPLEDGVAKLNRAFV